MARLRTHAIVVSVASLAGVVLARGAGADPVDPGGAAAPAPAPAAAPAAHGEGEQEEPSNGDNPYESGPARPAFVKQAVVQKDGMLRIPGGRFLMGSSSPRAPRNERPQHSVALAPYWIDRTEVTVAAFRACVDAGACARPPRTSASCTYDGNDGEMPVSCVHWRDADAYCHFAGKRLPSEAEWEFAARGPFPLGFPWGGVASCKDAVTLVVDQSATPCLPHPAHVGSHPTGASVFGALDMTGNVEEWVADWYTEIIGAGPAPTSGSAHVLRGGSWLSPPTQAKTTTRNWGSALEAGPDIGFRCARDD